MIERKFNIFVYAFRMFVCSVIWTIFAGWVMYNLSGLPKNNVEVNINPISFTFELNGLIAILLIFVLQSFLLFKFIYYYSFRTNCKNPTFCLLLNIFFGGFIVLVSSEYIYFKEVEPMVTFATFIIMAFINYFLFYAKNGYEFREKEFLEDWNKKVYKR